MKQILSGCGFEAIEIVPKPNSREIIRSWNWGPGVEDIVVSAYISARKPSAATV